MYNLPIVKFHRPRDNGFFGIFRKLLGMVWFVKIIQKIKVPFWPRYLHGGFRHGIALRSISLASSHADETWKAVFHRNVPLVYNVLTRRAKKLLDRDSLHEHRELLSNVHLLEKASTMLIGDSVKQFRSAGLINISKAPRRGAYGVLSPRRLALPPRWGTLFLLYCPALWFLWVGCVLY